MQHVVESPASLVHQLSHVFCHATRNGVAHQQVLRRIVRIMVGQDLLDNARGKRFQVDACGFAAEERLVPVLKDALHHGVDATTGYEMHVRLFVVQVPHALQAAHDSRIHIGQPLKLVNNQRYLRLARVYHQFFQNGSQGVRLAMNVQAQHLLHLLLQFSALQFLGFLTHKEVEERSTLKCPQHQRSFARAPAPHQHSELRSLGRQIIQPL